MLVFLEKVVPNVFHNYHFIAILQDRKFKTSIFLFIDFYSFQVSPLHMRMQGTLPVKALLLKDVTAKAKVCLFGDNASSNYAREDVVQVSAVFPKTFQNQKQLTTSPISKCQVC